MRRQKSILPGVAVGVKVLSYFKKNKFGKSEKIYDINHALRSFKKELKASGRMEELRERRYFTKKSEKKRVQLERAKYFQWVDDQNNM